MNFSQSFYDITVQTGEVPRDLTKGQVEGLVKDLQGHGNLGKLVEFLLVAFSAMRSFTPSIFSGNARKTLSNIFLLSL